MSFTAWRNGAPCSPASDSARDRSGPPLAYGALMRVDHEGAYANLLLPRMLDESRLADRNRRFVTDLSTARRACGGRAITSSTAS